LVRRSAGRARSVPSAARQPNSNAGLRGPSVGRVRRKAADSLHSPQCVPDALFERREAPVGPADEPTPDPFARRDAQVICATTIALS